MANQLHKLFLSAWSKAIPVKGVDREEYRIDSRGAWIRKRDFRNCSSPFGWYVERIACRSAGTSVRERVEYRAINVANRIELEGEHKQYVSKVSSRKISLWRKILSKIDPQIAIENVPCDISFELKGGRVLIVRSKNRVLKKTVCSLQQNENQKHRCVVAAPSSLWKSAKVKGIQKTDRCA